VLTSTFLRGYCIIPLRDIIDFEVYIAPRDILYALFCIEFSNKPIVADNSTRRWLNDRQWRLQTNPINFRLLKIRICLVVKVMRGINLWRRLRQIAQKNLICKRESVYWVNQNLISWANIFCHSTMLRQANYLSHFCGSVAARPCLQIELHTPSLSLLKGPLFTLSAVAKKQSESCRDVTHLRNSNGS
jgi:hypothetical protein